MIYFGAWPLAGAADSVLIFGGTGNTGSRVAKQLTEAGDQVTVFVRPTSKRERLAGYPISFAVGDVHEPATVATAFSQAKPDVVIVAMQSRPDQSPHGDPEINVIRQAQESGVTQFIYVSSVGAGVDSPGQRKRYPDINFSKFAEVLAEKGRVEAALLSSDIGYTIVRTGAVLVEFGREPPPGTGRAYLTEDQDVVGPVTYDDLAALIARCSGAVGCINRTYHATDDTLGPEFNHWRCRRFAPGRDLGAACDHLRPLPPARSGGR